MKRYEAEKLAVEEGKRFVNPELCGSRIYSWDLKYNHWFVEYAGEKKIDEYVGLFWLDGWEIYEEEQVMTSQITLSKLQELVTKKTEKILMGTEDYQRYYDILLKPYNCEGDKLSFQNIPVVCDASLKEIKIEEKK